VVGPKFIPSTAEKPKRQSTEQLVKFWRHSNQIKQDSFFTFLSFKAEKQTHNQMVVTCRRSLKVAGQDSGAFEQSPGRGREAEPLVSEHLRKLEQQRPPGPALSLL
jgi:hypothetical protein